MFNFWPILRVHMLIGFMLIKKNVYYDSLTITDQEENRTKTETTYSAWLEIIFVVPQGSILGPLLFEVF